jgi:hypothetical protein
VLFIKKTAFDFSDHPVFRDQARLVFLFESYILTSDVFVDSFTIVGPKGIGLNLGKTLTLELSNVKE